MATRIKLRYDTYANWNSASGTLSQGELGLVDYGDRIDIHAGTEETPTVWSSCPIVNEGVTTLSGLTDVNLTDLSNGDVLSYSSGSWIGTPGVITINGVTTNLGGTHTITAATQNSLTFGTGFSYVGENGGTFDGSDALTVNVDLTGYPLTNNSFFVGNSSNLVTTIGSTGSGSVVRAGSPTISGTLSAENLILSGNLTVNGSTTTLNTTTLTVDDKNIELGSTTDASDITADGGGITLKGTTDKTFNWVNSTSSWTSSENLDLVSTKEYKINGTGVLKSDALGSGLFSGTNSRISPQNDDKLLIYHSGDWSSWITWANLKSNLEAAISGIGVDLIMPSIFSVLPSFDTNGITTFTVDFENQTANNIFAGPSSGSPAKPAFRTLVTNDLPDVSGLTPSTYTSVTVDAKGRVTAGTNPSTLSGSNTSTQSGYFGDIFLFDDTNPSHYLQITNISDLTALRTLSINVENSNRTITLGGNLTVSAAATISGTSSGTNTGDQTITLTGAVTGTGMGTFATSLNANLDNLLDVSFTNLSAGNILVYDGTQGWINSDVIYGGNASSFV